MKWLDEIIEFQKKQNEIFQKSIPANVFYNHFDAVTTFIDHDLAKIDLRKISYYNSLIVRNTEFDIERCKRLFWNSWSTENAFHLSIPDSEFYKFALHWHFPQAYYSIYLCMTAFHETQGIANDNHEKSIKLFGNSVKDGHYPKAISYYATGGYNDFSFTGISNIDHKDFNVLTKIVSLKDAEMQIASFLKSTRIQNAENKKNRGLKEFSKNKNFQNIDGELVKRFTKKHWDMIYAKIPETTLLNLIYRLRIKANYLDIETFINADLDFEKFHGKIGKVVSYLNFVHEAYFCNCVGVKEYEKILESFRGHVFKNLALKRFEIIKKIQ
ncbi:hypothetical protein [Flavobacterium sp.]|uniref:hypothetical protein n=1 Tax=Flavobacterium sp. TaxID=239 RepID=UPI0038CF7383